jgi:hypothetical protein
MGVAGGVVLGSFLADMLTPDAAVAGEASGEGFGGEDAGLGDAQEPALPCRQPHAGGAWPPRPSRLAQPQR